jgi:tetratricopeptide (TPR) repeat protein
MAVSLIGNILPFLDREADRRRGADFARRALEVAGDAMPASLRMPPLRWRIDRALALNPNYARGWHVSGLLRLFAGQPEIAIEHLEAGLRLSPRARVGYPVLLIGAAHFFGRRFDEAVPKLLFAISEEPSGPLPYRVLAACYAHMGRLDEAREIVARQRVVTPVVIPDASYLRNPDHRELFLSGLRLAAGEAREPDPPARRDAYPRCGGLSRLMGADEEGTLERLKAVLRSAALNLPRSRRPSVRDVHAPTHPRHQRGAGPPSRILAEKFGSASACPALSWIFESSRSF